MACSHGVIKGCKNHCVKEQFTKCGRGLGKPTRMEPCTAESAFHPGPGAYGEGAVNRTPRKWGDRGDCPMGVVTSWGGKQGSKFSDLTSFSLFSWCLLQAETTGSKQTGVSGCSQRAQASRSVSKVERPGEQAWRADLESQTENIQHRLLLQGRSRQLLLFILGFY